MTLEKFGGLLKEKWDVLQILYKFFSRINNISEIKIHHLKLVKAMIKIYRVTSKNYHIDQVIIILRCCSNNAKILKNSRIPTCYNLAHCM